MKLTMQSARAATAVAAMVAIAIGTAPTTRAQASCPQPAALGPVIATEAIDLAWSSTYVGLDLLTAGNHQLVAYYNATRNLVVAHRRIDGNQGAFYGRVWNFKQLDTMLGWDNHNSVVTAISKDGRFHVMGNMHADRMVYYRTKHPGEVRSLERVELLVDERLERRVTYPRFLTAKDGTLFVRFRFGGSGNGDEVYYRYDDKDATWSKIHAEGFADGEGKRNAYFSEIVRGPDGDFHMAWVWRSQGGSTMNSMVSYAKSSDFVNWQDAAGNPLALPITYGETPVAAAVPDNSGMVNGHQHVGFDAQGRPLVTYVRYDQAKIAQAYLARFEGQKWSQYQVSNLSEVTHQKNRKGNPTPRSVQLRHGPVVNSDGSISLDANLLNTPKRLHLDGTSLDLIGECERSATPPALDPWRKPPAPGLQFRWIESRGNSTDVDNTAIMSWYSMPGNRDRGRADIIAPSTLRVHVLRRPAGD